MRTIVFDTETTGLIENRLRRLSIQPWIVELFALKVDSDTGEDVDIFHSHFKADAPLSKDAAKVTGLTDEFLANHEYFSTKINEIETFFNDSDILVGQNIMFDLNMMKLDFKRCGRDFSWDGKILIDLLEVTEYVKGHRMKLGDMYEHFFSERFSNAHEAEADVRATARIFFELKQRGEI